MGDILYKISLQNKIPVFSLDQHLPGDSILDQIQATFLHENKEFEKISQTFGMGNYSRHDFCFNIQYGADKSFKDILAQISTKIQLIRTDGQVGYEGEMSLDMFSESEISTGAVRSVLMPFRCSTRGCENIFPVDVELSIRPSPKKSAETGAVGLESDNLIGMEGSGTSPTLHGLETQPLVKTEFPPAQVQGKHRRRFKSTVIGGRVRRPSTIKLSPKELQLAVKAQQLAQEIRRLELNADLTKSVPLWPSSGDHKDDDHETMEHGLSEQKVPSDEQMKNFKRTNGESSKNGIHDGGGSIFWSPVGYPKQSQLFRLRSIRNAVKIANKRSGFSGEFRNG